MTTILDQTPRTAHAGNRNTSSISGQLYRYHGFTVFDANGERVGIVDWIWTNDATGTGDHIGLQLQWLRGKARAIPATDARVDRDLALVLLPFTKEQMMRAPRFRIDRALTSRDRNTIAGHFAPSAAETGRPLPFPLAA